MTPQCVFISTKDNSLTGTHFSFCNHTFIGLFFNKSGLGGSCTVTAHIWSAEARSRLLLTALGGTGFSPCYFSTRWPCASHRPRGCKRSANHSCSLSAIFDSCRSLQTRSSPPGPSNPINPQPKVPTGTLHWNLISAMLNTMSHQLHVLLVSFCA